MKDGYPDYMKMDDRYSSISYPFVGDFFGNHK